MTNITTDILERLLPWSAPQATTTRYGVKTVRTASPNGAFWSLWRENKEVMRDVFGISPKPVSGGEWIVNW